MQDKELASFKKIEITKSKEQEEKIMAKSKTSLRELWSSINWINTHYGSPREKRERTGEKILFKEIMSENFPNLMKDMNLKPQESPKIACKK